MHGAASDRLTILVVDDEPKVCRLVRKTFAPEGWEVLQAPDGETGVALVESERPDLVLLDLTMPRMDGMEACRRIREISDVPIIMLTGRIDEGSRIAGLDLGADDYVAKPFSPGELAARVRALFRRLRSKDAPAAPIYDDGTLRIDLARREVSLKGEQVSLSRIEFRLLEILAGHPGQVFLHEQLRDYVWGRGYEASADQLRTYVRYLRRKIEPKPASPRYLLGQRGVGYFFRAASAPAAERRA
jgi:DNA-binding response OmpR family regulator